MKRARWDKIDHKVVGYNISYYFYQCSECHNTYSSTYNFCPSCGMPMNDYAFRILCERYQFEEQLEE